MLRLVLLGLVLVPVLELVVAVLVGHAIGGWPTVGLLVVLSLLGGLTVKRAGARAWHTLRGAVRTGRMPSDDLADATLVLVGGVLLLVPGFVTAVLGLLVLLPVTRPLARVWLAAVVGRRLLGPLGAWPPGGGAGEDLPSDTPRRDGPPDVIRGEIVD